MNQQHRRTLRRFILTALTLVAGVAAAQTAELRGSTTLDGPYVMHEQRNSLLVLSSKSSEAGLNRHAYVARIGDRIDIPSVGQVPSFSVALRPAAKNEPEISTSSARASLFVVADTHGEYEILVELLQKHGIIDESMHWTFRAGHLTFLGDVFDRGPNQIEILWLIYKLEAEAKKARGRVHFLLGNHEHMILSGDVRYLNPKYIQTAQALGVHSYSVLFAANTVLGQWLRTKPTVLKLNDLLCLHGGISREVIERKLSLQQINSTVRAALNSSTGMQEGDERTSLVLGKLGPLWYRGYFAEQKEFTPASSTDIDDIRKYYGVDRILVGHTIVPTITSLYDGKVIAVQVYPHRDKESDQAIMEALLIERGHFFRAKIDGSKELLH